MKDVDRLIQDSIDMHIHAGPDSMPSSVDSIEAASQAEKALMRAIVLKSHFYATAPIALITKQFVSKLNIFGSLCLNYEMGGLNPYAVEMACMLGSKVLWMPTLSSNNSRSKMSKLFNLKLKGEGFSIINSDDRLVPQMFEILELVKKHDMILASGHISPQETFILSKEAKKLGIRNLLVTHANSSELVDQALSLEQQKLLSDEGVFIEYAGISLLNRSLGYDLTETVKAIRYLGAENIILSTDMGPASNPFPVEGFKIVVSKLLGEGISEDEIELMIKKNPANLLGIV